MNEIWAVILAAGSGTRLAEACGGVKKQFLPLAAGPLYFASLRTMARVARVRGVALVFAPADLETEGRRARELFEAAGLGLPLVLAAGGERRQDSVRHGLAALPASCDGVLVHDAARPFASATLVNRVIDAMEAGQSGVIPAIAVKDTIKRVDGGLVAATLDRAELAAVQTPQGFPRSLLEQAHQRAQDEGWDVTDDASMVERLARVAVVEGEETNVKVTTPEDLALLAPRAEPAWRTGHGYDVHKYAPGRPMVLGGIAMPKAPEVAAHSDGDVLLHALTDALLGCACAGDIGRLFPDTDPAWDGADSAIMVKEALERLHAAGFEPVHADLTIICQTPKIAPHARAIRDNVARLLLLDSGSVNIKATTEEGLGFTGRKEGIKATAVVTARQRAEGA